MNEQGYNGRPQSSGKLNRLVDALNSLDVRARPWEAKSPFLLEFERHRVALDGHKYRQEVQSGVIEQFLQTLKVNGGSDDDLAEFLSNTANAAEWAQAIRERVDFVRTPGMGQSGEKAKGKEKSLEERERQARLDLEAQRLIVQKLVRNSGCCIEAVAYMT